MLPALITTSILLGIAIAAIVGLVITIRHGLEQNQLLQNDVEEWRIVAEQAFDDGYGLAQQRLSPRIDRPMFFEFGDPQPVVDENDGSITYASERFEPLDPYYGIRTDDIGIFAGAYAEEEE